jgi:uncharacterized protein (DUF433 family)
VETAVDGDGKGGRAILEIKSSIHTWIDGAMIMTVLEQQPLTLSIPLYEDPPGVLRVGKSRVLLELVIHAFQRGETPEGIVQSYDTLSLPDVYAVVSYYLANPASIDEYLRECDAKAEVIRRKIEKAQPPRDNLRQLIMTRAKAKGLLRDQAGE